MEKRGDFLGPKITSEWLKWEIKIQVFSMPLRYREGIGTDCFALKIKMELGWKARKIFLGLF